MSCECYIWSNIEYSCDCSSLFFVPVIQLPGHVEANYITNKNTITWPLRNVINILPPNLLQRTKNESDFLIVFLNRFQYFLVSLLSLIHLFLRWKKPGLIFYVVQCNIDLNLDPGFLSCTLCWLCTFKHFSTSSWGVKRLKTLSKSFLSCSLSLWMFTVVRFFFCDCFKNLYNFALVFLKNDPFHVMRLFWTSLHWAKQTIWSLEVFYRVLVWTYLRVSPHRFPQQTDKHGTAITFHLLGLFVARLQRYGLLLAVLGYCL